MHYLTLNFDTGSKVETSQINTQVCAFPECFVCPVCQSWRRSVLHPMDSKQSPG